MALAIDFHFCWIAVDFCYLDCSWFDGGLRLVSVEYLYIISNWGSRLPVWSMTLDLHPWSRLCDLGKQLRCHIRWLINQWAEGWQSGGDEGEHGDKKTNLNCTVAFPCGLRCFCCLPNPPWSWLVGVDGRMGWRLMDSGESEGAWVEVWASLWSWVTIELSRAWEIAEDRGKKRHDWIGTLGPNVMGFVEQNC